VTADRTAYDRLAGHAYRRPDAVAVTGWATGEDLTFGALHDLVDRIAVSLGRLTVPGDRVVLVLPNEVSFPAVLLAGIRTGLVAVPAPVPSANRTAAFRERLSGIVADCRPALVVTDDPWAGEVARLAGAPTVPWRELAAGSARPDGPAERGPIAFLQYTSGSTGRPRGVVVTHDGVAASCRQAAAAYAERTADIAVTWVPLFHDMGLVTGIMRPLYTGYRSVLLRPEEFSRDPASWLRAISRYRGTLSSAPNFGYELCVRKVPAKEVADLDLSSWRVARNAGETVRPETLSRFAGHLAPAGLPGTAMCPSYGLAEATLAVTTATTDIRPVVLTVDSDALDEGLVRQANPGTTRTRTLLSSGTAVDGTEVRVAGGADVGEIEIRGPQLSPGYWGGGTAAVPGDWRPTGDLGFVHSGQLFVLGRIDDTLVYQGKNHYLSDVLAACAGVDGIRPGRLAALALWDEVAGLESVCVVAELRPGLDGGYPLGRLATRVKRALLDAVELPVARVEFVPAGTLPVTTSGKVRASEALRRLRSGNLPLVTRSGSG
jgi:acyl-CoA synthetase (AMP-forming)/AMP-acid ligase II